MSRMSVILCALLISAQVQAQTNSAGIKYQEELKRLSTANTRVSVSGQFVIHDMPASAGLPLMLDAANRSNYVRLDSDVLAVTCERVKQAFLATLGASDDWRGKISIFMRRARSPDEPVIIAAPAQGPDWAYYLEVPDTVEYTRLVSAVVASLEMEAANRGSARPAEIPLWLIQGMTRELICSSRMPLVVDQPQKRDHGISGSSLFLDGTPRDALYSAREDLRAHAPLTLEQLSWPPDGQDEAPSFRGSAQLFVHELLALNNGRRCMSSFIAGLSRHLNWQISFLDAFQNHFSTERDVDKWWTLKVVGFTGRDLSRTMSAAESWHKLDETLRTAVQIRTSADELPLRTEISLQAIILEWSAEQQSAVLKEKLQQLYQLRSSVSQNLGVVVEDYQTKNNVRPLQVSQNLIFLVDDYRKVLEDYCKKREDAGFFKKSKLQVIPGADRDGSEAINRLNALDGVREELRPASTQAVTANQP